MKRFMNKETAANIEFAYIPTFFPNAQPDAHEKSGYVAKFFFVSVNINSRNINLR